MSEIYGEYAHSDAVSFPFDEAFIWLKQKLPPPTLNFQAAFHPIIRRYHKGSLVSEMHLPINFENW